MSSAAPSRWTDERCAARAPALCAERGSAARLAAVACRCCSSPSCCTMASKGLAASSITKRAADRLREVRPVPRSGGAAWPDAEQTVAGADLEGAISKPRRAYGPARRMFGDAAVAAAARSSPIRHADGTRPLAAGRQQDRHRRQGRGDAAASSCRCSRRRRCAQLQRDS